MKISHYSFGKIIIDGKTYTSDIIIYPDHIDSSWWRREGHLLQIEDVEDIIKSKISTVIIGTGFYGTMKVSKETINYFQSKNTETHIQGTQQAVELYNAISEEQPVIAALHLTC